MRAIAAVLLLTASVASAGIRAYVFSYEGHVRVIAHDDHVDARSGGDNYLWVRFDGGREVTIRDEATLRQVHALFTPLRELAREKREAERRVRGLEREKRTVERTIDRTERRLDRERSSDRSEIRALERELATIERKIAAAETEAERLEERYEQREREAERELERIVR